MAGLGDEHADALRAEFGEPVVVLGVSSGGSIALQLAAEHPDVVRKLGVVLAARQLDPLVQPEVPGDTGLGEITVPTFDRRRPPRWFLQHRDLPARRRWHPGHASDLVPAHRPSRHCLVSAFRGRRRSIPRRFGAVAVVWGGGRSALRPDPVQRPRPTDIRDNLIVRIAEAEREGWLGEVEGLQISLVGAQNKLDQLDAEAARRSSAVGLGMPAFADIANRTTTTSTGQHRP
ncbi:alpha/beta fold hydrolase [Nocardia grenadensis]